MAAPDPAGSQPAEGNGRLTEAPRVPPRPGDEAPSLFESPRRVALTALVVLLLFAAIYVLLPKLIGLEDAIEKIGEGEWQWFAVAVGFNGLAFGAYVALFRGVIGENLVHLDWRESYQITMAGLAASRVLSAGGAGGVVLSYWALRKAGMRRVEAAERMVAFLALLYAFYVLAVIVFGVLLETGVLAGPNPVSMTIIPAAIAGGVAIVFLLIMLVPGDLERRLSLEGSNWASRAALKLSQVPATISTGIRLAFGFVREPRKGGLAMLGAAGFWAANIGILWATFMAFGVALPIAVLVMGFFIGMAANLAPDPAGVGAVDGGLIGAFVIFGEPGARPGRCRRRRRRPDRCLPDLRRARLDGDRRRPRLSPDRLLDAAAARDRRLSAAPPHGGPLGGGGSLGGG